MNGTKPQRKQVHKSSMIESLETRALMSATLGGFGAGASDYLGQPTQTTSVSLLPAVQKTGGTTPTSSGIIAILIGL
jgi:hypothetical protein